MDLLRGDGTDGAEHVRLLVAHLVGAEGNGGLHGDEAEDLEQVVLDHVPQGPGLVVIVAPAPHPVGFGHGDLHVVDVVAVPDRLKQGVGEAEGQDILHRLLAQVMIDAEDLGFVEEFGEVAVQGPGRVQVAAERLFHHDAVPHAVLVELRPGQFPGHGLDHGGWQAQVKDAVGPGIPLPVLVRQLPGQFAEDLGLLQVGGHEGQVSGEAAPALFGQGAAGVLVHARFEVAVKGLLFHMLVAGADDAKLFRQPAIHVKAIDGRDELAPGQVAGGSEDDKNRGLRTDIGSHAISLVLVPLGVEGSRSVHPFVGMGPEVIPLGLDQVGGQLGAAVGDRSRPGLPSSAAAGSPSSAAALDHLAQIILPGPKFLAQIGVQQQVGQVGPGLKSRADVLQQGRPDDAAAPPDAGHGFQVQPVAVGLGGLLQQGHPLGVGGDHAGEEGVLQPAR